MVTMPQYPRALGILQLAPHLLFQLTLENYCATQRLATRLHTLADELASPDLALASEHRRQGRHQNVNEIITRLLGGNEMTIPGITVAPLLNKISEACWRLVQHKSLVNEETLRLCDIIDRTKGIVLKIRTHHSAIEYGDKTRIHGVQKEIESLLRNLRTFGKTSMKTLELFRDDANVLYYLLRRRECLDGVLPRTRKAAPVATFLLERFPKGTEQMRSYLHKKYRHRGFEELIPSIDKHIESLSMEQGCPPPTNYTLN